MKKILVLVGTLVCVLALDFSACTSRLIPPSEEYLSPPEPEKVEYIAKPPNDLAELLFSSSISEQSKATTWSNAQGKWIVWVGKVHRVEPQLKPSRIVFLYEYEPSPMSFDSGQFAVTVKFDLAWAQQLKQLTTGESVYYRAKLVKYDLSLGSYSLTLEEGEIVASDDSRAVLADLAYSRYDQLDRLVAAAEKIAALRDYFERKVIFTTDVERNLTKFALKLVHIELRDDTQLKQISLPEMRTKALLVTSMIEENLQYKLALLHNTAGADGEYRRQDIEPRIETIERVLGYIEDGIGGLEGIWERDRRSAEPGIGDLTKAGLMQLVNTALPEVGIMIGIPKAAGEVIADITQRPLYEQAIVICETYLSLIVKSTQHIQDVTIVILRP